MYSQCLFVITYRVLVNKDYNQGLNCDNRRKGVRDSGSLKASLHVHLCDARVQS